jgi:hypothetical protein
MVDVQAQQHLLPDLVPQEVYAADLETKEMKKIVCKSLTFSDPTY